MKSPLKNGLELVIHSQVFNEFLDQYPVKRELKQAANQLKKVSEKEYSKQYFEIYKIDPEMSINICKKTAELAEIIGKMDISEIVLFSDFAQRFYDNREIAKTKGMSFFDKILL